jgi:membrane protein DedA with SNARE-associated domain
VPFWRYTVLTLIGSALWCFAFAGIGWALGRSWDTFHHDFRYADYVVVGLVVVAAGVWLFLRWRSSRLAGRADDPAG